MFTNGTPSPPPTQLQPSPAEPSARPAPRFTTLRIKLTLLVALTVILLVIFLYIPLQFILLQRFIDLEQAAVVTNLNRTNEAVTNQLSQIVKTSRDYSVWDDTYDFVETRDQAYIADNLADAIFINNQLNFILILDAQGEIVFSKALDWQNATPLPFPAELETLRTSDFVKYASPEPINDKSGIFLLPGGPALLSSTPIYPLSEELLLQNPPIRGSFIFGRYLGPEQIAELARITKLNLAIYRFDQQNPLDPAIAARLKGGEADIIKPLDDKRIQGFTVLRDVLGQPALGVQIEQERSTYNQGRLGVLYFMASLAVGGLIFGLVVIFLLERIILARLARLNNQVQEIGRDGDGSERVVVQGSDELSNLSLSINEMLAKLEQSQGQHLRSDAERVRLQDNLIRAQKMTLDKLSTPVIPISDSVIVMPLIGDIDDHRAGKILETLLKGISEMRTRTAIIDLTGILGVNDEVIDLLTRMGGTVRLLGAELILTGITAEIAQKLAENPTKISGIKTYSNLQQSILYALRA